MSARLAASKPRSANRRSAAARIASRLRSASRIFVRSGTVAIPSYSADRAGYADGMCRNIRPLYNFEPPATHEEIHDAALQYVRKISGFTKPSRANAEAFERAVDAVAAATAPLLDELSTIAPPKYREVGAAKRRARAASRTPVRV